jgi:hypothetical protein
MSFRAVMPIAALVAALLSGVAAKAVAQDSTTHQDSTSGEVAAPKKHGHTAAHNVGVTVSKAGKDTKNAVGKAGKDTEHELRRAGKNTRNETHRDAERLSNATKKPKKEAERDSARAAARDSAAAAPH